MKRLPVTCLLIVAAVFFWSMIDPFDRTTWWLEVAPVIIVVPLLLATRKKFPMTNLLYVLIAIHCVILMVGGHYTYAKVPLFNWIQEITHSARNSYDGLGHLAQGFIPAIAIRELLLRTSPLRSGKWLFAIVVFSCFGIAAVYELIEYAAAIIGGGTSEAFLGTQGDVWDTQKDMLCAGVGAILALITLSKIHDKQLAKLQAAFLAAVYKA